ncbi:MAG: T9SS type A sorting domain-containing protein [Bacteroidetes bacterium]|nr:T9SS type A sorting domain-containing protein [Bacteroidota bacterium]
MGAHHTGSQWEEGRQVRCDAAGNVYVAGGFYAFGTAPFPPYPFAGVGSYDPFVAKYNRHGEFQWAQWGGSPQQDYALGLATTDSGKVYFTGSYADNLTLGNTYLPNVTGPGGWTDMYYAEIRTDITTGNPNAVSYCAGASFSLPFIAHQSFKSNNVFTAQLSDATGRFASAINIGTLNSTTSGSINCTLHTNVAYGIGYRLRVIASDTVSFGNDNGTDITINTAPVVSLTANDNAICTGDSATLTTPHNNGNTYKWYFNNALINGAVTNVFYAKQTGNYKVRVTNAGGCSVVSPNKLITVNNYPSAVITATGPLTYCSTDSVILSAPSGVGYTYQWRKGTVAISNATNIKFKPTTSGTYRVLVTNAVGCSTLSNSKKLTIRKPVAQITADSTSFCMGDSLDLRALVNNSYIYQWIKGLNNIANATLPTYFAKTTGTYKVQVTDTNGCSLTSNKITIYAVSCRKAESFIGQQAMHVFPVPAQQYFEIKTSNSEKVLAAILTSAAGQVVEQWQYQTKIKCEHIPSGMYTLTVVTESAVYKKSLVIIH